MPVPAAPKGRPHRAWGPRPRPNARLPQTAAMAHCWLPRGRGELEAARAEWHAMDKTDERVAMRRARNLAMSRSASIARVTPHAEPRRGARRETERELLAITFKTSPHAAYHPPARPGVYLGLSATHRGRYSPLSRAARGAHPISPPPGRESKPRLSSSIKRTACVPPRRAPPETKE